MKNECSCSFVAKKPEEHGLSCPLSSWSIRRSNSRQFLVEVYKINFEWRYK
jgi:hypothetical protein